MLARWISATTASRDAERVRGAVADVDHVGQFVRDRGEIGTGERLDQFGVFLFVQPGAQLVAALVVLAERLPEGGGELGHQVCDIAMRRSRVGDDPRLRSVCT